MIKPNDQIGPYTLIRHLGKGGFGVVWLAERRSKLATTQVAVKIILDQEPDLDAIGKESQVWVKAAGHPNVLSIIEANVYDDQVVIVSEYAPDGSLDGWLRNKKDLSLSESINLTVGILSGLEHLHSQRIIHRDLKPANILLNKGVPRLADFGLARVMKSSQNSGSVAGTPAYMAPEAFDGKRFVQSDIWSVGVILYQLVSKQMPFPQTDMTALIGAIITRDPQPLPGKVPISIQKIILKALEKNPAKRFQSAIEMRLELEKIYSELDVITLKNEAVTMHMSQKAFTPKHLSEFDLQNDTSRNKLDTNTGKKLVVNTFGDENVPKTSRVITPISIPPTVVMKPPSSNWKSYLAVALCAIVFPIGGYTYFQAQNSEISTTDNKTENTAKVVVSEGLAQNNNAASLTNISNSETNVSNSKTNLSEEKLDWQNTRNSSNPIDYENFIKKYPSGIYTGSAQAQLKELIRLQKPNPDNVIEDKMNASTNQLPSPMLNNSPQATIGVMRTSDGVEREVTGSNIRYSANQNNFPQNQNNYPPEPHNKKGYNPSPKNSGKLGINGKWQQQGGVCSGSIFFLQENGGSVSVTGNETCGKYGNLPVNINAGMGYDDILYETTFSDGQVYQVKIKFDPSKRFATKYCRPKNNPKQEDVSQLIRLD